MTIGEKLLRAKTDFDEVHEAGYNEGYTKGYREGCADGYDDGYWDGYWDGANIVIEPLLAQKNGEFRKDAVDWGEGHNLIGDDQDFVMAGFDIRNYVDWEETCNTSNPYTIIVNNYHPFLYLHCYIYAEEHNTNESFREVLIIGPEESNSIDLECSDVLMPGEYSWQHSLYWRFSLDGT